MLFIARPGAAALLCHAINMAASAGCRRLRVALAARARVVSPTPELNPLTSDLVPCHTATNGLELVSAEPFVLNKHALM